MNNSGNLTKASTSRGCQAAPEDNFEWVFEGLFIFLAGGIGVLGNGISMWTFSRQKVHRIFHNLLLTLAIFDLVRMDNDTRYLIWFKRVFKHVSTNVKDVLKAIESRSTQDLCLKVEWVRAKIMAFINRLVPNTIQNSAA